MRIVGGSARGRALAAPKAAEVIRPTADRVRETIFNVLGQRCDGLQVLDLFAGTGALGLEAVSRGATRAVLVDRGREALTLCKENAQTLGFSDRIEIIPSGVIEAISALGKQGRVFELIFSDPPYAMTAGVAVLEALSHAKVLCEEGMAVIEHGNEEVLPPQVGDFERIDHRTFGTTDVSIFRLTRRAV